MFVNKTSNTPDFAPSLQTSNSGQTHSDQTKPHSRQALPRSPLLSSVRHLHFCRSLRPLPQYTYPCLFMHLLPLQLPSFSSSMFNAFSKLCRKLSSQHFSVKDVDTAVCVRACVCVSFFDLLLKPSRLFCDPTSDISLLHILCLF